MNQSYSCRYCKVDTKYSKEELYNHYLKYHEKCSYEADEMVQPLKTICHTHNMSFDSNKYPGCIQCTYKQCQKCHKYNIKRDSQYNQCFTCNNADKQPCTSCQYNLVKLPFKYCYTCNQSYKKQPLAPIGPPQTLDSLGFKPSQYPMNFFHQ